MADELLACGTDDIIYKPNWENIVGDKTLENGGYVGDLLTIARLHLEGAKEKGELREEDAGTAYSQIIIDAMKDAIAFETTVPKTSFEMCFLRAQIAKLECECRNETALAASTIQLNAAQIEKLECECTNDTAMTASNISLNTAKEVQSVCECTNATDLAASTISLNAANENKLACDCCNISKETESKILLNDAQIDKLICDCCNETTSTNSKVVLDKAQADKLFCDCQNETNLANVNVQKILEETYAIDIDLMIKVYQAQLVAWAVVFADADLGTFPTSIAEKGIDSTYESISEKLAL